MATSSFSSLLADPSHDAYYFVDTNMIIAYCKDEIPDWIAYVDFLSAKGKRFFVTERIAKEFTMLPTLPSAFHVFTSDDADYRARMAYPVLMRRFESNQAKFSTDLHWLLESGFCMSICPDIPLTALANTGRVFAITANAHIIRRFIRTPDGRRKFEKVVDEQGLDHLADIRGVCMCAGTFEDFSAFD
jgi:hypothetical protein